MSETSPLLDTSTVTYLDLRDVYYKFQKNETLEKGKVRRQRIRNGKVKINIQSMQQIVGLSVWVQRMNPQSSIPVAFPKDGITIPQQINKLQHEATVDIDSIYYESPESEEAFYKLHTHSADKNKFQLITRIEFVDESLSQEFFSNPFILETERKRPHPVDPDTNANDLKIIGTIEADSASFGRLIVKDHVQLPPKKADIAYHYLKLNDLNNSEELEEGDVVGFFEHQETGDTYIKRLTVENNDKIVHAGVISRSAFLEGNRPMEEDDYPTDTVCVLGIVCVKVVGSVLAGERVYASNAFPGKAIPQSHLLFGIGENHEVLLGMALQSVKPKRLDEVLFVRCFVCVVLGVSSSETQQEMLDLYQSQKIETKTEIKLASKRHWKKLCCCFSFLVIFLALLAFTIYQIFSPGSTFRYWLCERGCISGHKMTFVFSPLRDPLGVYKVRGFEFTYEDLLEKTSPNYLFPKRITNTSNPQHDVTHYYLNVDRCAYGYAYGEVGNIFTGYRKIGGGKVLAVNWNCYVVYWAAENPFWTPYNTSSYLRCQPPMP